MNEREEHREDEKRDDLDLHLENEALEQDIEMMGGVMGGPEDIDPKLKNAFLHSVLAFEQAAQGPKKTIRSLFPDGFEFPPPDTVSEKELGDKLAAIRFTLEQNNIFLDLQTSLPARLVYKHFVDDCLDDHEIFEEMPPGYNLHLDGCGGYCPGCFQKDYCSTAEENWSDEAE